MVLFTPGFATGLRIFKPFRLAGQLAHDCKMLLYQIGICAGVSAFGIEETTTNSKRKT
jgi:hypothetical protein